jgi:hypothetical protein
MSEERTTDIVARAGGVMTDEVGAVTARADVAHRTRRRWHGVAARAVPRGGEWYEVTGSRTTLAAGRTLDEIHTEAVAQLGQS